MVKMIRRLFDWWIGLFTPKSVFGWFVGAILSASFILTYQSTRPPSHMLSATEDDGSAVIGGQLVVLYHNSKNRFCRNNVTRWLYNPTFTVAGVRWPLWVPLGTSAAPPVDLGDQRYALGLVIPPTAVAGQYHYTATTDYDCGLFSWLQPPSVRSPDMVVQLIKPAPGAPPQIVLAPAGAAVTVVPEGQP